MGVQTFGSELAIEAFNEGGVSRFAVPTGIKGKGYMNVVVTLVERGGEARSFHTAGHRRFDVEGLMVSNIKKETAIMTDEALQYRAVGRNFASHEFVNHTNDEYVHGIATTNTIEGFFSIFKRGMRGVYQHCCEKHLHCYLAEFDFRYSNCVKLGVDDVARADRSLKGIIGKRLTYATTA